MIYALFFVNSFVTVLGSALVKMYRKRVTDPHISDSLYFVINITVALVFYGAMCGFDLKVNAVTLLFSVLFAVVSFLYAFLHMHALENTTMVNVSLFTTSGELTISAIAGLLLFHETIRIKTFFGFAFTFLAMLIPYMTAKKGGGSVKGILFCWMIFLNSGLARVLMKLYQTVPGCMDENVFCFYTNVFMIPFMLLLYGRTFLKRDIFTKAFHDYKKPAVIAAASVIAGNIATLLSMAIIGKVDLFFASVFGPPLTICINFLFDIICFREPLKPDKFISVAAAVIAVLFMI